MSIRRFTDQRHEQRSRQGTLRHELADRRRDRHDQRQPVPGPLVEGQDVEEHQAPREGDPAPEAAVVCLRGSQRPHDTAGLE